MKYILKLLQLNDLSHFPLTYCRFQKRVFACALYFPFIHRGRASHQLKRNMNWRCKKCNIKFNYVQCEIVELWANDTIWTRRRRRLSSSSSTCDRELKFDSPVNFVNVLCRRRRRRQMDNDSDSFYCNITAPSSARGTTSTIKLNHNFPSSLAYLPKINANLCATAVTKWRNLVGGSG